MKRELSLVIILAFATFGAASTTVSRFSAGRIVGGEDTNIEDHPYQISLIYFGAHRCGGSVITENWVITAAHCVNTLSTALISYLQIRTGSSEFNSGGTLHDLSEFVWHNGFSDTTYDYDIALIKVKQPFEFSATLQPIQLAPPNYILPDGTIVAVSGWGRLSSGGALPAVLQVVEVPMINNTYCGQLYSYLTSITDRMICAGYTDGGKDACQGDSGGPLFYGNILVGLVSWGDGCAVANQPGVYTSVSNLRDWVSEQTGWNFD